MTFEKLQNVVISFWKQTLVLFLNSSMHVVNAQMDRKLMNDSWKAQKESSWMCSCLLLGSRRQSEWCSGWSPAKPSRTHSHTLIDRLLCPHHPMTSSFMCISPYPSLSLYIYICVTLSPSEGVPVNSRVSSKIQQLLNTLKRPKRPPLPEFFVDDFEELLDGRFTTFRKRFVTGVSRPLACL